MDYKAEYERLHALLNTPEIEDFIEGLRVEAAHQRERWGEEHDEQKTPEDWFWVIGYLAGKALNAQKSGDMKKLKHHLITGAAILANQHRLTSGRKT